MRFTLFFVALFFAACLPADVLASAGAGGGLPYESALESLVNSITGPVAWTLSVIGLVVALGALIFGGDMSGFARTMILMVILICVVINATNIIATFTGKGAVIATASVTYLAG